MTLAEPRCWWCGSLADSREHRFKSSQLKRMLGRSEFLMYGGDGPDRPVRVNGAGSRAMRFPKVLCQRCNNVRSQPFDRAYDLFTDLIWRSPTLFQAAWLDWRTVFDGGVRGAGDLCRYYVKNFGCRIAETGFAVPEEVIDFMNGSPRMPHATVVLYKDFSGFDQWRRLGFDEQDSQHPFANRMFNPVSAQEGPVQAFCAELQDGPVGAAFWWDASTHLGINFCSQRSVPLRDRRDVPYPELHETEWARAELMKRTL